MNLALKAGWIMKNKLFRSEKFFVGASDTHGYGVFCTEDIKKGELIEECYYIIPDQPKWQDTDTKFCSYFFSLPFLQDDHESFADENGGVALYHVSRPICVLGCGMIFNHSKNNNVDWNVYEVSQIVSYRANQNIKAGSELFIKYNDYADFKNAR
jgi:SET domain-containing protein